MSSDAAEAFLLDGENVREWAQRRMEAAGAKTGASAEGLRTQYADLTGIALVFDSLGAFPYLIAGAVCKSLIGCI